MSIKSRFGLALGLVLLLHLFTAVMGHVGLDKSQRDFVTYEQVNADTIAILSIDRTITELQRNVSKFMLTGNDAPAERVRELLAQADTEIATAIVASQERETRDHLAQMSEEIQNYGDHFDKVATDRAARIHLVHDEMYPTRNAILNAVQTIANQSDMHHDNAKATSESMLLGETAALRYLDAPSGVYIRSTVEHLQRARSFASTLPPTPAGERVPEMITAYERAFLESVQATRGYLHLVNVVLAGQASELLYNSSQIRSASLQERAELSASMQAGARRFQFTSDGIAILTVLAGMILASLMTRTVLRPVLAITSTLRSLARGDSTAEIDGLDRTDEIGAMANAAEVFRIKNIQTETLLAESRRMATDLEQRNEEMSQFVYTVSHDLKSPLVTIQGYAGMMQEFVNTGDQENLLDSTSRIIRASDRMFQTLTDLLELSRIGALASRHSEVSLDDTVQSVLADLRSEIAEHDVRVRAADSLPSVWGEDTQIRQVLQNLVHNAIKHAQPKDGQLVIEIDAVTNGHETILTVSDNGPGVNPEYTERIFGIFQRLSNDTPGTGVGLAIVKKIGEAHGGRAWVTQAPNGGACFCVSLTTRSPADIAA